MVINIVNSKIKRERLKYPNADLYLTESDFHPCRPFFLEHPVVAESADLIYTKGILEDSRYLRYILFVIDSLLSVNGILEIDFFQSSATVDGNNKPYRPQYALMNEVSLRFKDRIKLLDKKKEGFVLSLRLQKRAPSNPATDSIGRWSFCLVSGGGKNDRIVDIIRQIEAQRIPDYEILICGPKPCDDLPARVRVLDDSDLYLDSRIPIARKKNRLIREARYNNMVILHDRYTFPEDWYRRIAKQGNYFDLFCIRILDEETQSKRVSDWIARKPGYDSFRYVQDPYVLRPSYDEWYPGWNVNGGFMIIKKHVIEPVLLNPYLHWGEAEDGDLCDRLRQHGAICTFYKEPYILTQTHRIGAMTSKVSRLKKLLIQLYYNRIHLWLRLQRKRAAFNKYLNE